MGELFFSRRTFLFLLGFAILAGICVIWFVNRFDGLLTVCWLVPTSANPPRPEVPKPRPQQLSSRICARGRRWTRGHGVLDVERDRESSLGSATGDSHRDTRVPRVLCGGSRRIGVAIIWRISRSEES